MLIIQTTRQALGVSQNEFATLVDCDRGILAMAEIGKRLLPTSASLALVTIQNAMLSTDQFAIPTLDATAQTLLNKHTKRCEAQLQQKQLQLNTINQKIQQAQQVIHVANILGIDNSLSENARLQWTILQRKASLQLKKHLLLRIKTLVAISGLTAEIAYTKTL